MNYVGSLCGKSFFHEFLPTRAIYQKCVNFEGGIHQTYKYLFTSRVKNAVFSH